MKTIGIVAPSFLVPNVELELAVDELRKQGLSIEVHPQCYRKHLYFAGTDTERAQAVLDFAYSESPDILWCARGGYGAARILPHLEAATQLRGLPPKKLLVGYSDATALHEFVRARWGWKTLHAPMPGLREFFTMSSVQKKAVLTWVSDDKMPASPSYEGLKYLTQLPKADIQGDLVGGNLSVVASLLGTRFAPTFKNRILFLEDIGENFYKIDRYFEQIKQSGALDGARAIVLGTFESCRDVSSKGLKTRPSPKKMKGAMLSPKASDLKPLRPEITLKAALGAIFGEVGAERGIPVVMGLKVGHGNGLMPLLLGASYRLTRRGALVFER